MSTRKWITLTVLVFALALVVTACSDISSAAAGDEVAGSETVMSKEELGAKLIELEKTKWGLNGDENFLTMVDSYADDFVNIGWFPTGAMRLNKEEAFAMVPPPSSGPPPELSDFLVVHPHDGSAIVTYKITAPWATVYATSVYADRDGQWQTVFYQATDTAVPAAMAMPEAESAPDAAAEPQQSDIVVTIAGGTCTMNGPALLPAGHVKVTLDVQDSDKAGYSAAFVTLPPDKTLEDLLASTNVANASKPEWANEIGFEYMFPDMTKDFDMTIESGPIYLLCFSWNQDRNLIGHEGPIEVTS